MKNHYPALTLAGILILAGAATAPAFAQQLPAPQSVALRTTSGEAPAPKPKPKKVWTEDSIPEVRTAADHYQDQKAATNSEASKPADGDATSAQHKGLGGPPLVLQIPKTPEETQQAIDKRKELGDDFRRLLSNARERLETETDPMVRATLEQKMGLLNLDIKSTDSEIRTLQKALEAYKQGKAPEQPKLEESSTIPADQSKPAAPNDSSVVPQ